MKNFLAVCLCVVTSHAQMSESYEELLAKAHAGDGHAAYSLGKMFEHPGIGKTPDFSGAAYWYTQASKQAIWDATTDLASFYLTGTGVPRDEAKALELFHSAATAGYPRAMTRLGEVMIANHYHGNGIYYGRPWIEKAAEAKDPDALNDLGSLILIELPSGAPPQIRKALPVFQKAAELGSCMALFNIGNLYLHGSYEYKFAQEPAEALRWFKKVKTCGGATPELSQQAADLEQRTAKGELPPLSRQEVLVPDTTISSDVAALVLLGLMGMGLAAIAGHSGNSSSSASGGTYGCWVKDPYFDKAAGFTKYRDRYEYPCAHNN